MKILFEATDPRGYRVICTERIWDEHVCLYRPWMADQSFKDEALQAIQSPMFGIYADKDNAARHIYYRLRRDPPRYFKVVVEFDGDEGILITAFPTQKTKAGEYLIWPVSNR